MRRMDITSIAKPIAECLSKRREVEAAYVFGSFASGRMRPASDVDVAVLLRADWSRAGSLKYRLRLVADIARAAGRSDIDLVILNEAPPVLAHQVLSSGKLVFERSASARVQFQVRAINNYLDTEPMRALYRRYLKKRIREGKIFG
jgi:predicted nucleotidyltransferase